MFSECLTTIIMMQKYFQITDQHKWDMLNTGDTAEN